jgi:hypothetical protein
MYKCKFWAPKKLSIITCFITNFVYSFVTTIIIVHHVKFGINILLGNVHTIYISTSFTSWELLMSTGSCIDRMTCLGQWFLFYPQLSFQGLAVQQNKVKSAPLFLFPEVSGWKKILKLKPRSQFPAFDLSYKLLCHTTAKHYKNYYKLL